MRELGAGVVISELISATGLEYASRKTRDLCAYFEEERPVGLQIFGESAEHLASAAREIEKRGGDFVDINLGCPVPKVVSKGGGAAMLRDPAVLYKTLAHVKSAIKIPLTIKIRTGWDASSVNALENIHAAAEAGVAWVAIHGRTRAQAYEGQADWELLARLKEKSPVPIIGNGDVLTAEQAVARKRESGCDGVMIGRAALRNPFIFLEIARLEGRDDIAGRRAAFEERPYWSLVSRHYDLMKNSTPPFYTGVLLRKFMTWYSAGMEGAARFRGALYEIPTEEENLEKVLALGREFFDRAGVGKSASYLSEPFLQGGHG
ncbi:MAG: tRNA-dihydrouridine synthase family protein [Deltaproteobacteria bacterium]|nr:tRNA-dihydrouridine synthase family protein [Deltaproteobacteria bacterium]